MLEPDRDRRCPERRSAGQYGRVIHFFFPQAIIQTTMMSVQKAEDIAAQLAAECAGQTPETIVRLALERFPDLRLSFSGSEDVVLVQMASRARPGVRVFCLDTGRLHQQTLEFIEQVRERYPITLELLVPEHEALERLVREKGLFSFYRDGHQECCAIRKVQPLLRHLRDAGAWMSGLRRDQAANRSEVPEVQLDHSLGDAGQPLIKFNPLAKWTSAQVWDYIHRNELPCNPLHKKGYVSIGCAPCTRPILPGQQEREGRWWWESREHKECGLHRNERTGNV